MCFVRSIFVAILYVAVIASPLHAHPDHNIADPQTRHLTGFDSGFFHPLFGLDHFLVMVAIGTLSVRAGGNALSLGPLSFLCGMAGGGMFGVAHAGSPVAEMIVALSVVALGLTLSSGQTPPRAIMFITFALFGCLHGYAHGVEIPGGSNAIAYGCGFLLGSIILHALGISFGLIFNDRFKLVWANPIRLSGAAIAAIGFVLMTQT